MRIPFTNHKGKPDDYYLDVNLIKFLNNNVKKSLQKNDKDYVVGIDGYEGAGKSTFAIQMGMFVDPTLTLDRVCLTSEDFKRAILDSKPNQCVIYDEAVTGMTAGDSITKIGRLLKSMMMQMRQKNLFVIIILPSLFELNKYAILSRMKSFFHVYEYKGNRGFWTGFNKRDTRRLYLLGKKTYSYLVKSPFRGRFLKKIPLDEEKYKKIKTTALFKIEEEDQVDEKDLFYNRLIKYIKVLTKFSNKQLAEALKAREVRISEATVARRVKKI